MSPSPPPPPTPLPLSLTDLAPSADHRSRDFHVSTNGGEATKKVVTSHDTVPAGKQSSRRRDKPQHIHQQSIAKDFIKLVARSDFRSLTLYNEGGFVRRNESIEDLLLTSKVKTTKKICDGRRLNHQTVHTTRCPHNKTSTLIPLLSSLLLLLLLLLLL